jgi:hypothetical protein
MMEVGQIPAGQIGNLLSIYVDQKEEIGPSRIPPDSMNSPQAH